MIAGWCSWFSLGPNLFWSHLLLLWLFSPGFERQLPWWKYFATQSPYAFGRSISSETIDTWFGVQHWQIHHSVSPQAVYYTVLITILLASIFCLSVSWMKKKETVVERKHPVSYSSSFSSQWTLSLLYCVDWLGFRGWNIGHTLYSWAHFMDSGLSSCRLNSCGYLLSWKWKPLDLFSDRFMDHRGLITGFDRSSNWKLFSPNMRLCFSKSCLLKSDNDSLSQAC